jgi:hypothetical protein
MDHMKIRELQLAMVAVSLAGAMSASATFTVAFDNVSPEQVVTLQVTGDITYGPGGVYAGIYNLTVAGVATPSFCIDVQREAGTFSDYSYAALADAPNPLAGPMNATAASNVEKLWAAYFAAAVADSSGVEAAALQVAIWEQVALGKGGYTVTVSGNDPVTTLANTMTGNLVNLTAEADLRALVSPTGQNYVVPVPEPTTMLAGAGVLGLALLGMGRARGPSVVRIGK